MPSLPRKDSIVFNISSTEENWNVSGRLTFKKAPLDAGLPFCIVDHTANMGKGI